MNEQKASRLRSAGPALALAATGLIIAWGWSSEPDTTVPVDFELAQGTTRVIDSVSAISPERVTLGSIRRRLTTFAETGEARHLRYAERDFEGWLSESSPGPDALIVRARLQQSKHDFENAAKSLRAALALDPGITEGWLLLADAERRAGHLPSARRACLQLGLMAGTALAQYCAIPIALAEGNEESAYRLALSLDPALADMKVKTARWAAGIAADAAAAVGQKDEAIRRYEEAMTGETSVLASRLALADLLIDANRASEVETLLDRDNTIAAARIRIARARQALGQPMGDALRSGLEKVFPAVDVDSADPLSLKDRALYELHVQHDAENAVRFAFANWTLQKSYEDLALAERAAIAANDRRVLRRLRDWQENTQTGAD